MDNIKTCKICSKKIDKGSRKRAYCSFDCKLKSNKNRYREKPDKTTWFSIVEFINERDNYCCVECGDDKNIYVHHIKFLCDGGSNKSNNLITLCSSCHGKKHKI